MTTRFAKMAELNAEQTERRRRDEAQRAAARQREMQAQRAAVPTRKEVAGGPPTADALADVEAFASSAIAERKARPGWRPGMVVAVKQDVASFAGGRGSAWGATEALVSAKRSILRILGLEASTTATQTPARPAGKERQAMATTQPFTDEQRAFVRSLMTALEATASTAQPAGNGLTAEDRQMLAEAGIDLARQEYLERKYCLNETRERVEAPRIASRSAETSLSAQELQWLQDAHPTLTPERVAQLERKYGLNEVRR